MKALHSSFLHSYLLPPLLLSVLQIGFTHQEKQEKQWYSQCMHYNPRPIWLKALHKVSCCIIDTGGSLYRWCLHSHSVDSCSLHQNACWLIYMYIPTLNPTMHRPRRSHWVYMWICCSKPSCTGPDLWPVRGFLWHHHCLMIWWLERPWATAVESGIQSLE